MPNTAALANLVGDLYFGIYPSWTLLSRSDFGKLLPTSTLYYHYICGLDLVRYNSEAFVSQNGHVH